MDATAAQKSVMELRHIVELHFDFAALKIVKARGLGGHRQQESSFFFRRYVAQRFPAINSSKLLQYIVAFSCY